MAEKAFGHRLIHSVVTTLLTVVIVVALLAGVAYLVMNQKPDVEDHSWLVVDIYGEITEYDPPGDIMSQALGCEGQTLQNILDNLSKAALDDRIEGVIWKLSSNHTAGWAKLQEMRAATDKVQAAGKKVYAWGDAINLPVLYLASTCDAIYMPGGGYIWITGLMAESIHIRGLLDKLGIVPHLHKIKDYKAAAEMVANKEMSEPAREMRTWMVEDTWDQVVPAVAAERGLSTERFIELMAYAEFEPVEAAEAGLIDELLYWQDLKKRLKREDDDELRIIDSAEYAEVSFEDVGHKGKKTVAVIHAQGIIAGRDNRIDPLLGIVMGHESIANELRRARRDDDVEAVVLRVDSGGGEGLASDLMAHEVELTAAKKPVVVSMVDVAGSGGYYIAYKATKMLADPLTRTGSIGSINGFFNMKGFYDKIGFSKDFVVKGPMAQLGTDYRDPTDEEWERHVDAHWKNFNSWLADVAEHRGITFAQAESLAHGRVFTGRQAAENGLIDGLGHLDDAVRMAADLAGIDPETVLKVVHLPEKQSLLQMLVSSGEKDGPVATALRWYVYRTARQDLQETARFLNSNSLAVMP